MSKNRKFYILHFHFLAHASTANIDLSHGNTVVVLWKESTKILRWFVWCTRCEYESLHCDPNNFLVRKSFDISYKWCKRTFIRMKDNTTFFFLVHYLFEEKWDKITPNVTFIFFCSVGIVAKWRLLEFHENDTKKTIWWEKKKTTVLFVYNKMVHFICTLMFVYMAKISAIHGNQSTIILTIFSMIACQLCNVNC